MLNRSTLDLLVERIAATFPQGASPLREDLRKNIKAALSSAFARMDLVTREEFDVQTALLQKTRARLEEMEKQIKELEASIATRESKQ